MLKLEFDHDFLPEIIRWAEGRRDIRVALLTSTRAVPGAPVDLLSDYDVILIIEALEAYTADRSWLDDFGDVLVAYWDAVYPDPQFGIEMCANVVQYANGLKIDFTLWPVSLFREIVSTAALTAELDAGYRVLLDKDHLTDGMLPPTYTAYLPKRPSRAEYEVHVNDFLSDGPYVAKCLWRGELLPMKWALDYDMKQIYLRRMLEWRVGVEYDWSVPTGSLGKGLKKRLPEYIWKAVEEGFSGVGETDNWEALARTLAVFRQVAIEVGEHLGYDYPDTMHQGVVAFIEQIRQLERP